MARSGRLFLFVVATLFLAAPGASALAAAKQLVTTQAEAHLVPAAGHRVPARQPLALRTFRTLDPLALELGRAAAIRQYEASAPLRSAAPEAVLFSGLSWDGIAAPDTTAVTPPDGGGGIGHTYYVEAVNERITVYDRATTASVATSDLSTFTGLPGTCDPYVMWDEGAQRWVVISIRCDSVSAHSLSIAFTKSADPTNLSTGWCTYTIDTGSEFPDYPKAGHNNSDWLVGVNDFNTNTSSFDTSELFAFKKPPNGTITTCPGSLTTDTAGSAGSPLFANGDEVFTPEPPDQVDSGPPPTSGTASDSGYFVAYVFGGASDIHVFRFNRDSSGTAHFSFMGDIGIASYSIPAPVPQPGTADTLDTSDTRGVGASGHVDSKRCGGCEAVWVTHTVDGPGGRSQIQWEELNPAACTGSPTCPSNALLQDGSVSSPTLFYFNGRMAPNGNGYEAVLNFDSGSATQLAQVNAISNTLQDPPGGTHGQLLIASSAGPDEDFSCSPCRWGDYAAAETDPTNNHAVWNNSMYLAAPNSSNPEWKTRLFAVSPAGPASAVTVSLSPGSVVADGASQATTTATVVDGSGNRVAGDAVSFSSSDGGETISSVTDNGDGTYTVKVTSSTTLGQPTITATDSSVSPNVSGTAVLQQTRGPAARMTVGLAPSSITANGISETVATATVSDGAGHAVSGDAVRFSSTDGGEVIGPVTDHGDGTYTATIASSLTPGSVTITATDGSASSGLSAQANLTQTPPGIGRAKLGHVRVTGIIARVPVACIGAIAQTCSAEVTLGVTVMLRGRRVLAISTRHVPRSHKKFVLLGSAGVGLLAGQSRILQLQLNARGQRLLKSAHRLTVRLTLIQSGRTVASQAITFRVQRKRRRR